MPQGPLSIGTVNNTSQVPAATLPLIGTYLVEVQPPPGVAGAKRQKVPVSNLQGGASAIAGNTQPAGFEQQQIAVGLAAVGTNRGNSLALTKQINIVATAASAAVGVTLPSAAAVGVGGYVDVYNDGPANAFHVYAAGSDTIDGTAGATGVNLTNAFWCRYRVTAALTFVSYRSPVTRSA